MVSVLLAAVVAVGSSIPIAVQEGGPYLVRVTHVKDMPQGSVPWAIADPGSRFDGSDMRTRGLPNRGLFFAGRTRDVCVLNFQVGGIISPYCVLAMHRTGKHWKAVWYARLPRKLSSFEELQAILEGGSRIDLSEMSWCNETGQTE